MGLKVELREHTARQPGPDGNPLTIAGKTFPLFPDERSIWIGEGEEWRHVGYVGSPPRHVPMFINHWAGVDPEIVSETKRLIKEEFGVDPDKVTNVPEPKNAEPDVTEYDEYGDD